MLNENNGESIADIIPVLPDVDITPQSLDDEQVQERVAEQATNQRPLLLWLKRSVLTINKGVKNKDRLTLSVNDLLPGVGGALDVSESTPMIMPPVDGRSEEEQKKVNMQAVSLSKKIIISPKYKAITAHDVKTSSIVKRSSVPPYYNRGLFLIPLPEVFDVQAYLNRRMIERRELVLDLVGSYKSIIESMKPLLGPLFNYNDYPDESDVESRYTFMYRFFNFETPLSMKEVSTALYEKEKAESDRYWNKIREEVKEALVTSYRQLVGHMLDSLKTDDEGNTVGKRYNIKSVKNIVAFIDKFAAKNSVSQSDELAELVEQSKAILNGVDITLINRNDSITNQIVTEFEKIQVALDEQIETFNTGERRFNLFSTEEV